MRLALAVLTSVTFLLSGSVLVAGDIPAVAEGLTPVQEEMLGPRGTPMPRFMVDAGWPLMPSTMLLGQVSGVAVAKDDSVWLVHRPHSLYPTDIGLAQMPSVAVCCRAAPPIVHFSAKGSYLGGWGGPDSAPSVEGITQWPNSLHGISVDPDGSIWVAGNGKDDHVVLNYKTDGTFIRAFGQRGKSRGNSDPKYLGNPSDIYSDGTNVYASDGYINKRIIGFDKSTGKAIGIWGAYGGPPALDSRQGDFDPNHAANADDGGAKPASKTWGDVVHCVVPTGDGQLYVCDRRNNRAQLLNISKDGNLRFVKDLAVAPNTGGTRTVTDIALSPDKKYLYIADMMNGRIWILLRSTHETLGYIGRIGRQAGQFTWLHSIATDSQGNIYATEVNAGRRVQKFVFTGVR